jgi:hypothetical protein
MTNEELAEPLPDSPEMPGPALVQDGEPVGVLGQLQ